MKYFISIMLCFLTCSVNAGINEKKLTEYIMISNDKAYTQMKKASKCNAYYYNGKIYTFQEIFYLIKTDFQEEIDPELNAKIYQLEDGTMMIEYYGCKFSCYPEHLSECPCKALH